MKPMDVGKIIVEGYSKELEHSQQRKARGILDNHEKPKTAYTKQ